MIKLVFVSGSNTRRVIIEDKIISMISSEIYGQPITFDLEKLDDKITAKLSKEELDLLKQISLLETEEERAKDIIEDFTKSGWELVRREK